MGHDAGIGTEEGSGEGSFSQVETRLDRWLALCSWGTF
jgi:hypothetical protein